MNRRIVRIMQALLIAMFVLVGAALPTFAQSAPTTQLEDARVFLQDGWSARARHAAADDFTIVCPPTEVLDPSHPCSESNNFEFSQMRDLVLVCPVKEVLEPQHPCAERRAQIVNARPNKFALVCPVKEVLDPSHPCAQTNQSSVSAIKFKIPRDLVLTCPVKEVLDPGHPCAR